MLPQLLFGGPEQNVVFAMAGAEIAKAEGNACMWGVKIDHSTKKKRPPILAQIVEQSEQGSHQLSANDHFRWLSNCSSPLQRSWGILILLYTFDNIRSYAMSRTPEALARAYFQNFEARFEGYIAGDQQAKIQAKSPTEIILAEWLILTRIQ